MTIPKPIQEVFDDLIAQFANKNKEYQGETQDLFRNFNQGAQLASEMPEQVLLGYVSKQIVSLYDAKLFHPERLTDVNFINEKCGDIAVYMVLLMAMARSKQVTVQDMERAARLSTGAYPKWLQECIDAVRSWRAREAA